MKRKTVCGWGINDMDTPTKSDPAYNIWTHLLKRCYGPYQKLDNPSYIGCSVSEDFRHRSDFNKWFLEQDWYGNELDKDIIEPFNKLYSPETCCFVPLALNTFFTTRGKGRGLYPLGVRIMPGGRFEAKINDSFLGKILSLGRFGTAMEAHKAWQVRKLELLMIWVEISKSWKDQRISEGLLKHAAILQEHIDTGVETIYF